MHKPPWVKILLYWLLCEGEGREAISHKGNPSSLFYFPGHVLSLKLCSKKRKICCRKFNQGVVNRLNLKFTFLKNNRDVSHWPDKKNKTSVIYAVKVIHIRIFGEYKLVFMSFFGFSYTFITTSFCIRFAIVFWCNFCLG